MATLPRPDMDRNVSDTAILDAVLAEIRTTATEAEARGFLIAVGRRLAAAYPLTGIVALDALVENMNRVWRGIDGGQVRLSVDADGIAIAHRLPPGGIDPTIVEGVYAGWFGALGNERLALKRLRSDGDAIAFHYGR